MRLQIELIYDDDCPNVAAARESVRGALEAAGLPPVWWEWNRASPDAPAYARRFGSPTVLVAGRDVAGERAPVQAQCCRIYAEGGRLRGVPSPAMIRAALTRQAGEGAPPSAGLAPEP